MKLLVVTSLKEYQKTVADIFAKAGIAVFSITETTGFKDHQRPNLLDDWFSSGGDHFNSLLLFSFTSAANAERALDLVKKYNSESKPAFPIRAFILPVDKSSYNEVI
jgi:hypothetical protein